MAAKKKTTKKASKKAKKTSPKPPRPEQLELDFDPEPSVKLEEHYAAPEMLEIGALSGEIISVAEFEAVLAIQTQTTVMLTVAQIDAAVRSGMTLDEALSLALESAEENLMTYRPKGAA